MKPVIITNNPKVYAEFFAEAGNGSGLFELDFREDAHGFAAVMYTFQLMIIKLRADRGQNAFDGETPADFLSVVPAFLERRQ